MLEAFMKSLHWIKLHIDILDDYKIVLLNDSLKWRFISVCVLAGRTNQDGYLPHHEQAAVNLRIPVEQYNQEMSSLANRQLVELRLHSDGDERWYVTNYLKRQTAATGTERARASRKLNAPVDNSAPSGRSGWSGWLSELEELDLTRLTREPQRYCNDIATIRCIVDALEQHGIACNHRTQAIATLDHMTPDLIHHTIEEAGGNIKLAIWRLEQAPAAVALPPCPLCGGRHAAESCAYSSVVQR